MSVQYHHFIFKPTQSFILTLCKDGDLWNIFLICPQVTKYMSGSEKINNESFTFYFVQKNRTSCVVLVYGSITNKPIHLTLFSS